MRWVTLHRRCSVCGLVYLRDQGDAWFFWIVMDRIPILLGIAAIFFGFRITTWLNGLGFLLAVAGPLVATMPQRQGAAVALAYLSRVYFRDPSDALPAPLDDRTGGGRTPRAGDARWRTLRNAAGFGGDGSRTDGRRERRQSGRWRQGAGPNSQARGRPAR